MKGSTYKNVKLIIYLLCFTNIIVQKWFLMFNDTYLIAEMYPKIYVLPCILLSALFYFHFHYYSNIFIQTRFNDHRKYVLTHCIDVFKECIMLSMFQLCLIGLLDFKMFIGYSILSLLSIVLSVCLVYCVVGSVYLLLYFAIHKFHICFVVDGFIIIAHYFYVIYWLMYGRFVNDVEIIYERMMVSLICFFIIAICLLIIYRNTCSYSKLKINQSIIFYIGYFLIEMLSISYLRIYTLHIHSFSFNNLELFEPSEAFIVGLFWVIPKLLIIFILFKKITCSYQYNLLFYMVRISNRFIWVKNLYIEVFKYLLTFSIIKVIGTIIIYQSISIDLIVSGFLYVFYMGVLVSMLMSIYFISKDIGSFNYYISLYLIIFFIKIIINLPCLSIIAIDESLYSLLIYTVVLVCTFMLNIYIINHDEYYG